MAGPQLIALVPASEYWLIVPDDQVQEFVLSSPSEYNIFPESVFIHDFADKFNRFAGGSPRKGWYLQQLIKLEALNRTRNLDRILIWDADTVPLREISFFDSKGNCRYFFGSEYHLPYFENIDRLMGLDKALPNSFIAQNFPITGSQIEAFFNHIEKRHQKKWWDAVIDSIDFIESSGFSEYETLGTFVSSLDKKPLTMQPGSWSRDGDLRWVSRQIRLHKALRSKHDFVAVERWTPNPWVMSRLQRFLRDLRTHLVRILSFTAALFKRSAASFELEDHFSRISEVDGGIEVIQIGVKHGRQSGPIGNLLQSSNVFAVRLVEPIPHFLEDLNKLYSARPGIEVISGTAGSLCSMLDIYYIDPDQAKKMNGVGPQDDWALGKWSNRRSTVVNWIYMNSWRGVEYRARIPEWIGAIEKINVRVTRTEDLIRQADRTLLVIEGDGLHREVVQGLTKDSLPRWILIDNYLENGAVSKLLISWGYTNVYSGGNSLFEINQVN